MMFLAIVALGGVLGADSELILRSGDEAPPFALSALDGEQFALGDLTGPKARTPKTVLLSFFSPASEASLRQVPTLVAAEERWRDAGVVLVFLAARETPAELTEFLNQSGRRLRILPDRFGRVSTRYGVMTVPHLALVDTNGRVLFQQSGESQDFADMLDRQLALATGKSIPGSDNVDLVQTSGKLVFGRVPVAQGSTDDWKILMDFLEEQVGGEVISQQATTYEQFSAGLRAGLYDIASTGALQYIEVSDLYEPLVKAVRRDQEYYYGIIFVKDDLGVQKLEQLRGRTIAFADKHSTSGYLFAVLKLSEAGLRPRDYKATFVGGHENVIKAVLDGKAAAGACFEDCRSLILKDAKEREERTSILGYTREIPADPILVKKSLSPALKDVLRRALVAAGDNAKILAEMSKREQPITTLSPTTATDYDLVRQAVLKTTTP